MRGKLTNIFHVGEDYVIKFRLFTGSFSLEKTNFIVIGKHVIIERKQRVICRELLIAHKQSFLIAVDEESKYNLLIFSTFARRAKSKKVREKCPSQFSNVKVRVL